jgi:hypothetical protein
VAHIFGCGGWQFTCNRVAGFSIEYVDIHSRLCPADPGIFVEILPVGGNWLPLERVYLLQQNFVTYIQSLSKNPGSFFTNGPFTILHF